MKSFKKIYKINATAEKVFKALTSAKMVSEWSGSKATMNAKTGSKFSLWGGSIHGKNILISPTEIIQDWKEENWETFSQVTFKIKNKKEKCEVTLIHENIPDKSFANIKSGWDDYYMHPLIQLVEENKNN